MILLYIVESGHEQTCTFDVNGLNSVKFNQFISSSFPSKSQENQDRDNSNIEIEMLNSIFRYYFEMHFI